MLAWDMLDHLSLGCQVIGFDLRYLYVNEAAARHGKKARAEFEGRTMLECYPGIEHTPMISRLRDCLAQRTPQRLENEFTYPDGSTGWFELHFEPVPQGVCVLSTDVTERHRKTEQARELRLSAEAHLEDLIEQAPDGIFIADLDGRYTRVNSAGCRLLGYAREELIGKTIADLLPREAVPLLADSRERLLAGGEEVGEWQLRHKDGHFVPVEVSAKILRDGRWQGFVRDITGRQQREQALRLAEARASGILAASADAIISIDEEQRVTRFNEGAARVYGYSAAEVLGTPLDRLVPERFRADHRAMVQRFIDGEEPGRRMAGRPGRPHGLRKNGEEFPTDVAFSRVRLEGAQVLTVAVRDMTVEHRREAGQRFLAEAGTTLSESLDVTQTLGSLARLAVRELADFCMVFLTEAGALRDVGCAARDPAKARLCDELQRLQLDRTRPNVLLETLTTRRAVLRSRVTPEQLAEFAQSDAHWKALQALSPRSMITVPLQVRERLLGVIALASSGPRDYDEADLALAEELARRAALAVDNAQLYEAARRATQAREEILAVVAHDLRNPLQGLQLQARVLSERAAGRPEYARSAELIERGVTRMRRLVQDLVDVSRIEAGKLNLQRVRTSMRQLLDEVVQGQRALATEAGLTLGVEAPGELPDLEVDHHRLLQVFENLIGNALKFTPAGGHISLAAAARDAHLELSVTDDGQGIPPDELPHVFERFWQSRASTLGAGLGLTIARGIVEAHGGRIWAESAQGRGTTVRFTLPTGGADVSAALPAMPATGAFMGTPASISARQPPHTVAIDELPLDSRMSDDTRST